MAYEKKRKQDICALAVSHEQCKTLSIVIMGIFWVKFQSSGTEPGGNFRAKLPPKAGMYSSNRTYVRQAINKFDI